MDIQLGYAKETGRYPAASVATRGIDSPKGVERDKESATYCKWLEKKYVKLLNSLIND